MVGRDFRPRHAILTMHIWFLHKRLVADKNDEDVALMVQEELFDMLWDDTSARIRRAGVHEISVGKDTIAVQKYTFFHLSHYDHVYTEFLDKPAERLVELRKLIWRHIYLQEENMESNFEILDRIAWYIDCNYRNIMLDWPEEYYKEARVSWTTLPMFPSGSRPIHKEDVVPSPWVRHITLSGVDYYFNPVTNEATYVKPATEGRARTPLRKS